MEDALFTKYSQTVPSAREICGIFVQAVEEELLAANEETARHGLVLTREEIRGVTEARQTALADTGRIDFTGELPAKLARSFCDSPYISRAEWASVLGGLIFLFYEAKHSFDTANLRGANAYAMADDVLIARMRRWFDYPARGSLDCLADLLSGMVDRLHHGLDADEPDRRALLFMGIDADEWLDARPEELIRGYEGDPARISHILDHD